MPKYTVKKDKVVNYKEGSRKITDAHPADHPRKVVTVKGGGSVEMSEADALAHADVLELSPADQEKIAKATTESESEAKKKK